MSDATNRLGLPLLFPSQALKHVTINDALLALDGLVHAVVQTSETAQPPSSAIEGELHIIAPGAGGAWAGLGGQLAQWRDGGWTVHVPKPGWAVRIASDGLSVRVFSGTGWVRPDVRCRRLEADGVDLGRGQGSIASNTAIGDGVLASTVGGGENTGVGQHALGACTNGAQNTAVGRYALGSTTSGQLNAALGQLALLFNSTGSYNTAAGQAALYANTTGNANTAVGQAALFFNGVGSYNTALGQAALYGNTDGGANTALGASALTANTTGIQNTAVGLAALAANTGGSLNTAVGHGALSVGTERMNCAAIGHNAQVTGNNQVQLGDSSTTVYVYGTVQNRSDARDKTDIRDTVFGLAFIQALRPVDFRWDLREDYTGGQPDGSKARRRFHCGLLAHEVALAAAAHGHEFGGVQDHARAGGADVMSLGYDELIAPLIKAVQELASRVALLERVGGPQASDAAAAGSERSGDPRDDTNQPGDPRDSGRQPAHLHQAGPACARADPPRRAVPHHSQRTAS